MQDELHAILKERGFKYAIVILKDVSVVSVGAHVAYFRIWDMNEQAYLDRLNRAYEQLEPDSHGRVEL